MSTLEHLEWRYAVKKFDPVRKIPEREFREILEVLRLAPSSFGLQPWKFIVIENAELRKKIRLAAWNQPQVTEASHLIVLCALCSMEPAYVKEYVRHAAETRGIPANALAGYEKVMMEFIQNRAVEDLSEWMQKQVYLAQGMLLAECARRQIDTCPMEGFEPEKVDEILELSAQNLQAVILCPVGFRSIEDKSASQKKIRFPPEQVFIYR